jgi:hypothetical protein
MAFLANAELVMDRSKSVLRYKKNNADLLDKIDQYSKKVVQLTIQKEFLEEKLVSVGEPTSMMHICYVRRVCHFLPF